MMNPKNPVEGQQKLEGLTHRLLTGLQMIELELKADQTMISHVKKKESIYRTIFAMMEKSFLETTMRKESQSKDGESFNLDLSTESILLPRELFPFERTDSKVSKSFRDIKMDSARMKTDTRAEKLRTIMQETKDSIHRRGSM
ncbi:hypothetical protein IV203_008655 [Nitzschia inconspicua]|uniref:Uncharacterized protein n=1 Tax=Nitzschia inconspicua TaxID=303405 RepID=A0A9K3KZG9_9STRA|nr:hypothetical protein IV203_008655 [Nitzschia inconspicua]